MFKLTIVLTVVTATLALPQLKSVPTLDGRIVGGEDADIRDYSYQLSLLFLGSHICGAVTISPTWALTAAHCLDSTISTLFLSIRAGSSIRNSGGQVVSVSEARVHPSYSRNNLDYDIAAIRLSSALDVATSAAIPLPPAGTKPTAGSIATISGWGTTTQSGSLASVLQVVQVPVVSQANCRAAYTVASVTDRMFCAGLLGVGGKDACQGDSGGPVIVAGVLAGLVSWGNGCAQPDFPGVYTSVPALREWVLTNTGVVSVISLLTVRAGSSIRNSGGQVVTVLQATVHSSYRRVTLDYDIAALLLSSAISTDYSSAAVLPSAGTGPISGATAIITGWGATSESGSLSTNLQVVQVPVVSQTDCRTAYSESGVTDRMFCAGLLEEGGKDACQGDSGGPVLVSGILTGLVSWGDGCARAGSPGVYTNLPILRDWITSVTGL